MALSRAGLLALLIALGAAVTGLVVWNYGAVDLGMTLHFSDERVRVLDVTPEGNAARNGWYPGLPIIDVETTDGSEVERGEEIGSDVGIPGLPDRPSVFPFPIYSSTGMELTVLEADHRWPIEVVGSERIATAVAGEFDPQFGDFYEFASIDRAALEFLLQQSIWIALTGLLAGVVAWRALEHGLAGPFGREHAPIIGAAIATPALIVPAVQVGTAAGVAAGFLLPAAVALILGLSLARLHPERQWVKTGMAASLVTAALATILVMRFLTASSLLPDDRGLIVALIAAIGLAPAAVAAMGSSRTRRERASMVSLSLVPAAALTLIGPRAIDPSLPALLLTALIGWHVLPFERLSASLGPRLSSMRSRSTTTVVRDQLISPDVRDMATIGLFALVTFFGLTQSSVFFVIVGLGLATVVGFALRSGFLGPDWTDAAIPVAAAVGLPITMAGFESWQYGGAVAWSASATALVGLSVAHLLASRHSDARWRRRLLTWSAAVAVLAMFFGAQQLSLALLIGALIPLIPGLPIAFADESGQPREVSKGLETMAIALTPAAAVSVLTRWHGSRWPLGSSRSWCGDGSP